MSAASGAEAAVEAQPTDLAVCPLGKIAAVGCVDGLVRLYAAATMFPLEASPTLASAGTSGSPVARVAWASARFGNVLVVLAGPTLTVWGDTDGGHE